MNQQNFKAGYLPAIQLILLALLSCSDGGSVLWLPPEENPLSGDFNRTFRSFTEDDPDQGPYPVAELAVYFSYQATNSAQSIAVKDTSYRKPNDAFVIIIPANANLSVSHQVYLQVEESSVGNFQFTWRLKSVPINVINNNLSSLCQYQTSTTYSSPKKLTVEITWDHPEFGRNRYDYYAYIFVRKAPETS